MNQQTGKKQTLKKYGVFIGMGLVFCISMWFIFKPSQADIEREEQQKGLNADIPDPQNAGIVDNKISAYEQESMLQKKEERMRSLQDYAFGLGNLENAAGEVDIPSLDETGDSLSVDSGSTPNNEVRRGKNPTYSYSASSSAAYADMNKTLNNFYEKKEDPEKEALKRELEALKMNQQATNADISQKPTVEEQVAIMEKSYQLAAKYMGNQPSGDTVKTVEKIKALPVAQLKQPVVSALVQPMTNEEFAEQYSKERNTGFHTSVGDNWTNSDRNTIPAVIHDNQTITNGQPVRVRITEPMIVEKRLIPANTLLTGIGKITRERVLITVSSLEQDGSILAVDLNAYDMDGQQGVHVPGSMELNAVKEIAGNMGGSLGSSINISQQSAGDQLLGDLGRSVIQGTSQYVAAKTKEVKVSLKAGYQILLLISENKTRQ